MVTMNERVKVIEETSLFSQLSEADCQKLASVFKVEQLEGDEILCRQDDAGDFMAVVVEGELTIEVEGRDGERTVVSRRGRGEVVGEMACLDPSARSATVRADNPVEVLVLTRSMLDELKTEDVDVFSGIVRGIAVRLAEALDKTNALISELLDVVETPRQADRPEAGALHQNASTGRSVDAEQEGLELEPTGALKHLDAQELSMLRSATEARRYEPGEVLCLEGEPAPEAYFVVEGDVEVLRWIRGENFRMARIGRGGFLGQRALLVEGRRSATLRAGMDGTTVFALSFEQFETLLESRSKLAVGVQETITIAGIRQLRQANEMAAYLGARDRKDEWTGPKSQRLDQKPDPESTPDERVRQLVEAEADDVESLASAYLSTALEDWEVTPSELSGIQVVEVDGEMSETEKKLREDGD